jgi:RimJ/RimL family protein N-acetyltransferase
LLRGEKVLLRAVTREDLPSIWRFNNDLEVELAGGGDPPSPSPLERWQREFERDVTERDANKAAFMIEADGKRIGLCGLYDIDWTARHAELGITVGDRDYWGQGYGRDAVRLLLDYAFRLRNLRRVWLEVHAANERAIRCYRACGFVEEGRLREHVWLDGRYVDNVLMGVLREEWAAEQGRAWPRRR